MSESNDGAPFKVVIPQEFYEDLDRRIELAVSKAISGNASDPAKKARYLTRLEVCELLSISLPTLSRYVSKGILLGQKIGNRILFDEAKLQKSLQDLPAKALGR